MFAGTGAATDNIQVNRREDILDLLAVRLSGNQALRMVSLSHTLIHTLTHSHTFHNIFPLSSLLLSLFPSRAYTHTHTQAGLGRGDVSVYECHDAFAIIAALSLEAIGFVPRGKAPLFAAEGRMCVCVCVCVCVLYEREREREKAPVFAEGSVKERVCV